MIVRWENDELEGLLRDTGAEPPLLVASPRWSPADLRVEVAAVWREVPSDRIADAAAAAAGAAGVLAVGGGSAIDLGKAVSAEAGLPLVSVPTTYSGAEWTPFYGIRDASRRARGGGGGAQLAGVLYEPLFTLSLPRAETVGTALNGLAHCAEALYVEGHNPEADEHAVDGAGLIGAMLPEVVATPADLELRRGLLEGAMHAGAALDKSGMGLGHAMAQALGGRYGIAHGALNALCLPPALRFNAEAEPGAVARFGEALGTSDPAARVEELARLGGYVRLRDLGVPVDGLAEVAEATVARPGARANPRPATAAQVEVLLRSIW